MLTRGTRSAARFGGVFEPRKLRAVPVIQFSLGLVSLVTGTAASPLRPHPGNESPVDKPLDRGTFYKRQAIFIAYHGSDAEAEHAK